MDRIVALLDDALASGLGSAAAVSIGDGGVEIARAVRGSTRRIPTPGATIGEDAPFDLASLTKPIATTAIAMVLVAEGKLDLSAPVRRWIPEASTTGTIGELIGHAAGCVAHVEFFRRLRENPPDDPRAALVAMAAAEPANAPGVTTVYSDLGYIQLGALLERAAGVPLEQAFSELVAGPLGLTRAMYGPIIETLEDETVVATEVDDRGVVSGRVHDENAYYGGNRCGHAGLFATIGDVATFAAAIVDTVAGHPRGRLTTDIVTRFATSPMAPETSWRLGWDTPSETPGVSHAGDRWPRVGAIGHTGFTGTSIWLDLPRRRWVVLLTNRVHPTRHGTTADAIKALRRAVNDAAIAMLDRT